MRYTYSQCTWHRNSFLSKCICVWLPPSQLLCIYSSKLFFHVVSFVLIRIFQRAIWVHLNISVEGIHWVDVVVAFILASLRCYYCCFYFTYFSISISSMLCRMENKPTLKLTLLPLGSIWRGEVVVEKSVYCVDLQSDENGNEARALADGKLCKRLYVMSGNKNSANWWHANGRVCTFIIRSWIRCIATIRWMVQYDILR